MSEDPGHKAMLYFLEVLMNSNGPLTISQMAGRFGSRNFSLEMRTAAGGNEPGLKKFLLKYPSLFTVDGNMVSLFDSSKAPAPLPVSEKGPGSGGVTPSGRTLPDVSTELEAVRFFQNKLFKKEEQWVQIRSLAGHLSQANAEVRDVVGPQLEFRAWLLKHPHIFEVQGELVGLRDGIAAVTTPSFPRTVSNGMDLMSSQIPPKTPPSARKFPPKSPSSIRRSKSFSERSMNVIEAESPPTGIKKRIAPTTMMANEYKAVMFLKDVIEKEGGSIEKHNITGHFSQAPEGVRNTIGWTKPQLDSFLQKNENFFQVSEDEIVSVIPNAKLNAVITGSRPQVQVNTTVSGRKGKVYHVAKLWGIIDLGKHEHVFFDKSMMKPPIDDLQKHFQIGQTLWFNAILAPKNSRAKWRATNVWREQENFSGDSDMVSDGVPMLSPSVSIEEEMNRFLPFDDGEDSDSSSDSFPISLRMDDRAPMKNAWQHGTKDDSDIAHQPSALSFNPSISSTKADKKPKANFVIPMQAGVEDSIKPMTMTKDEISSLAQPPIKARTRPLSAGVRPISRGRGSPITPPVSPAKSSQVKKFAEVACQTISTGDIIATQLFQEDK